MSGSSNLFNIPSKKLRPGPRLVIERGADGKTTATLDFTCRKFDIGTASVQAVLKQGTTLLTLYPEAGAEFDYLYLESWTSRDEPGGITTVTCNFSGASSESGDVSFDESSIVYTRNNALREIPVFSTTAFTNLTETVQRGIKACADGLAILEGDEVTISYIHNTQVICSLSGSANAIEIYTEIVTKGNLTVLEPTSEWTKTATGRGKLTNSKMSDFGKITDPPGSPAAPPDQTWLYTGATEQITSVGDGANSYSQTYTSGKWSELFYKDVPATD